MYASSTTPKAMSTYSVVMSDLNTKAEMASSASVTMKQIIVVRRFLFTGDSNLLNVIEAAVRSPYLPTIIDHGAILFAFARRPMPTASPLVRAASLSVSKKCEDIFGIRAANDNQKIMIVWVFALIGVILGVVGLVMGIVDGSFGQNAISTVVGLVIDVALFWIANNIKREAGK